MVSPNQVKKRDSLKFLGFLETSKNKNSPLLIGFKEKKIKTQSELLEEWESIQIKSYETLKAPRVGRDKEADNWLLEQYEKTDKKVNFDQFVKDNNGYYVLEPVSYTHLTLPTKRIV